MRVHTSAPKTAGGFWLEPVKARRGVDCAVLCGACGHVIAQRHRDHLVIADAKADALVVGLPATADCPFCHVPNLFEPKQLNVSCPQEPS